MAQLKILGAQRVKALTEILHEKRDEAIREVEKTKLPREEAEKLAVEEFGVTDAYSELMDLKSRAEHLADELGGKIGARFTFHLDTGYTYRNEASKKFNDRVSEIVDGDSKEKIANLKAEYKSREQRLWLCETLEEAKAIVGID